MKKYLVYLDKSPVSQNLIRIILHDVCYLQLLSHIDELDLAVNDGLPDTIIINSNSFDVETWKFFEARNPQVTNCKKLLLTDKSNLPHSGLGILKTPLKTAEFYRILDEKPQTWSKIAENKTTSQAFAQNRRIFERKPHAFEIFFCDETQRHIITSQGRDISLGGIFVEDVFKPAIGSLLFLAFKIDGIEHQATCQVARHAAEGFGVRFLGLSQKTTQAITHL